MSKGYKYTRTLVILAMLTALEIVLSRFLSFSTQQFKVGFAFLPMVIAAYLFAPWGGAVVAGVGDLVGALAFPIGAYFPGFTLIAALNGLVFGLLLRKRQDFVTIICAVIITQFIGGAVLNSICISILYNMPYMPLLALRVVQAAIMSVIETIILGLLFKYMPKSIKRKTDF